MMTSTDTTTTPTGDVVEHLRAAAAPDAGADTYEALATSELEDLRSALREVRLSNESLPRRRKMPAPVLLGAPAMEVVASRVLATGTWMDRVRAAQVLASLAASPEAARSLTEVAERTGAIQDPNIAESLERLIVA